MRNQRNDAINDRCFFRKMHHVLAGIIFLLVYKGTMFVNLTRLGQGMQEFQNLWDVG